MESAKRIIGSVYVRPKSAAKSYVINLCLRSANELGSNGHEKPYAENNYSVTGEQEMNLMIKSTQAKKYSIRKVIIVFKGQGGF